MDITQTMSNDFVEVIKAVLAAQSGMQMPERTKTNSHTQSSYAPLEEVLQAIRGPLAENGLLLTHHKAFVSAVVEGEIVVRTERELLVTQLTHTSGQWIRTCSALRCTPDKTGRITAQGAGSAETYARRYNIKCLLNLAEEDDDAQEASRDHAPAQTAKVTSIRTQVAQTPQRAPAVPQHAGMPPPAVPQHAGTLDAAAARKQAFFDAASDKMKGFLTNISRLGSDPAKETMVRAYIAKELSGDEAATATKIADKKFAKQSA